MVRFFVLLSCLFSELMAAFAAGNRNFANLAGQAQPGFAFGTTEVAILLRILQSYKKLAEIRFEVGTNIQVFLIFCRTLHSVL